MLKICVAVTISLSAFFSADAASRDGLTFKAGVGYDYLSQKYFVDSFNVSGPDSLLTRWELTSEYLNDFKARLDLTFRKSGASSLELRSLYEQTHHLIKLKLNSDWRKETAFGDLRWRSQFDWRDQYSSNGNDLGSYLSGSTVGRIRKPLGNSSKLVAQLQADITDFYGETNSGYDHYRIGGKAGIDQEFGLLTIASVYGFFMTRQVVDSQTLDYGSYGLEGSFSSSTDRLDIDLLSRWEAKDYNRPDGESDYSRFEADLLGRWAFSQRFFSRQRVELEVTGYDPADLLNNDYRRFGVTLLGGFRIGCFELGMGPDFELLRESTEDTSFAEDYIETAALADFSCLSAQGFFASMESRLGYRQLEYPNQYQSDFVFYELMLIADLTIQKRVNLNLLLSTDWEWHDDSSLDNRVVLLSSVFAYTF